MVSSFFLHIYVVPIDKKCFLTKMHLSNVNKETQKKTLFVYRKQNTFYLSQ